MITILCILCGHPLRCPNDTWERDESKRVLCKKHHAFVIQHIEAMTIPGVHFGGYAVRRREKEAHS